MCSEDEKDRSAESTSSVENNSSSNDGTHDNNDDDESTPPCTTDLNVARRRIRFSDEDPIVHRRFLDDDDENDISNEAVFSKLWYLPTDFVIIKKAARMIAKESKRVGYSSGLDGTFGNYCEEAQSKLNLWCKHGHSRRGLEEWANKSKHGQIRKLRRKEAITKTLKAQGQLAERYGFVDEMVLSKVSKIHTLKAENFAKMMGFADAFAVRSPNEYLASGIAERASALASSKSASDLLRLAQPPNHDDDHGGDGNTIGRHQALNSNSIAPMGGELGAIHEQPEELQHSLTELKELPVCSEEKTDPSSDVSLPIQQELKMPATGTKEETKAEEKPESSQTATTATAEELKSSSVEEST